ncbi:MULTISPECIES: hypothetical protein [Enterococcus]|uniref:SH3b domain-containing protein n=1 Tax=Enterococcus diestrammenae TaxID=1155073 RepID=A0ABV0EY93_9ENTE|nr:hypothetical protein [Enterococcus diestrammenae]KAF1299037.1 hypothetical protein BAU18_05360 [Enterococcus diestrammenae]HIX70467.1 hypothetical protein [Candidatus Enterococcus stercoravium]
MKRIAVLGTVILFVSLSTSQINLDDALPETSITASVTRASPEIYVFKGISSKKYLGLTRISYEYDAKNKWYIGYYL